MSYKAGSFDAARFKDEFGLETVDESKAYSEGSSTGTKQTGALGTYMTKDDYNRLKNSDKVWKAYAAVNGKDAAEKKREGGDMSLNTLDSLMDKLSIDKPKEEAAPEPTPSKPVQVERSPEFAHAKARVQQYTDDVTSGRTGKELFGKAPDSTSFLDRYKLRLGERLENGNYLSKKAETSKDSSILNSDDPAIQEAEDTQNELRIDY